MLSQKEFHYGSYATSEKVKVPFYKCFEITFEAGLTQLRKLPFTHFTASCYSFIHKEKLWPMENHSISLFFNSVSHGAYLDDFCISHLLPKKKMRVRLPTNYLSWNPQKVGALCIEYNICLSDFDRLIWGSSLWLDAKNILMEETNVFYGSPTLEPLYPLSVFLLLDLSDSLK